MCHTVRARKVRAVRQVFGRLYSRVLMALLLGFVHWVTPLLKLAIVEVMIELKVSHTSSMGSCGSISIKL